MSRPTFEVADIVRRHRRTFIDHFGSQLSFQQLKALNAIARCRTAELGGHVDDCPCCGHAAVSYNSCRNRHCPKCQAQARQRWLAAREAELLATHYFHVVFTLPHQLALLCYRNQRVLSNLLFRSSAETMLEIAADPKHLGAEIGFLSILHTWGQNLMLHPHVHCIVPAGGFARDRKAWIRPRYAFFLPVKVLSRAFRGKFIEGLRRAYRQKQLRFMGASAGLGDVARFEALIHALFREDWVVYAKPAMGGAPQVLRYLGRYTHRVAISNHRLLAIEDDQVTFRWKDYVHGNKKRKMTVTAGEFLRRFVQHVLPRGFVRIRHFGFLANAHRTALLAMARELMAESPGSRPSPASVPAEVRGWRCPLCGTPMRMGPSLTARQLRSRCSYFDTS
jgi:hypothetical protein